MADPLFFANTLHPDDVDRVMAESMRVQGTGEPFDESSGSGRRTGGTGGSTTEPSSCATTTAARSSGTASPPTSPLGRRPSRASASSRSGTDARRADPRRDVHRGARRAARSTWFSLSPQAERDLRPRARSCSRTRTTSRGTCIRRTATASTPRTRAARRPASRSTRSSASSVPTGGSSGSTAGRCSSVTTRGGRASGRGSRSTSRRTASSRRGTATSRA